jgi:uncharacterized protein involved in outer membrane biogenesis
MRLAGKVITWVIGILVVLIAAVVIIVLTFDWNRARPFVDDKVTQALGRQFTIQGDLKVGWRRPVGETGWRGWVPWPHFSAANITLANPTWAKQQYTAHLDEINFDVAVLPLLVHRIVIPTITLINPSVDLERVKDGTNNWTFKLPASTGPSQWALDLHDIVFATGNIAIADAQSTLQMQATIDTLHQPIPIGEVMKQQQEASRRESTQAVGQRATAKLGAQVTAQAASEARAASAAEATQASAASDASPANIRGAASGASANSNPSTETGTSLGTQAPGGSSAASAVNAAAAVSKQPLQPYAIGWTVKGTYKRTTISGDGKLGGVLALQDAARPFPIQADVRIGDTHIAVVGLLTDPAHLAALDLHLWLSGVSMAHLYDVTGVNLPDTPPYATEGRLLGQLRSGANSFTYENFTGRVGGSDLNGTLTYQSKQPRPSLDGTLVSNLLQFSDLAPIIGADSNASKAKRGDAPAQPSDKALPTEEFRTDRWKTIDTDVKFTGRRILKDKSLPITDLYTHVIMNDGVLSLDPLNFGVAGGTLSSDIHLDGSAVPLKGRFGMKARHLQLKQLFPTFAPMKSSFGEVNGNAALSATGNSPAALAGSSNGEVKVLVNDGAISEALLEEAGLNVANIVAVKLFGDKDVKINCAATDFVITDGILDSRVFSLDTEDAVINVNGTINMKSEQMDLSVRPHTKGFRVFSLRSPLYVKGTFKKPKVGVDIPALALRGGAAVGLGLINPIAALIPLLAPSHDQASACGQMIKEMNVAPTAPPPGKLQAAKAPFQPNPASPAGATNPATTGPNKSGRSSGTAVVPGAASIYKGN